MRIRRSNRIWYVLFGVFVGVALFSFLIHGKTIREAEAASLAGFDPGYIISDWQMGNYNSMSENDIQRFLTSKNPCATTSYPGLYGATWHYENGHFICLSEERFGNNDGEIGFQYGESAAHIIWQAAQDYRINPQVLLVLLQKETSLITDPIPNNYDYRKATGFGCPDTAACSSKYYGFKNQIRNAAALFRTVLDGGWTNYPLGNNYIQYNPNAACGGSVVNVRSLATSALYRYTPYQPNAGALAAGYGTASCGAYGNRNFYLFFEDWFGGIKNEGYIGMETPRYLQMVRDANRINPVSLSVIDSLEKDRNIKFSSKTITSDGELCLRTEYHTNLGVNACIRIRDLREFRGLNYKTLDNPRYFLVPKGTDVINSLNGSLIKTTEDQKLFFDTKSFWVGGLCLRSKEDTLLNKQACVLYDALKELNSNKDVLIEKMEKARVMVVKRNTRYYDLDVGGRIGKEVVEGTKLVFSEKLSIGNELCLMTMDDSLSEEHRCILMSELDDTLIDSGLEYSLMDKERSLRLQLDTSFVTTSGYYYEKNVSKQSGFYFVDKAFIDGEMCLRTKEDKENHIARCIMYDDLQEAQELNFVNMERPRDFNVLGDAIMVNLENGSMTKANSLGVVRFVDKTYWDGELCLRSLVNSNQNAYTCYIYNSIKEL